MPRECIAAMGLGVSRAGVPSSNHEEAMMTTARFTARRRLGR